MVRSHSSRRFTQHCPVGFASNYHIHEGIAE